ncbi:hypothetical protein [Photobacterium sp. OFAV2-7]|uniref:hypothetical protein n=1 Tax=Photobacterium sp. OFAV2-7 TaxID=2917748 RepID=UPI001EF58809|nr:hypothetical protein [Photobacterium sp. OFAV2-7]MCG7588722.1 hypothetical protein [Photobacterium sp. OFAV2-7]
MSDNLYNVLKVKYKTNTAIGTVFGVSRQSASLWRTSGVPETIALLCHLSTDIPYVYNPNHYDRDVKGLNLNIQKVTTNDHKPERIQQRAA